MSGAEGHDAEEEELSGEGVWEDTFLAAVAEKEMEFGFGNYHERGLSMDKVLREFCFYACGMMLF